MDVFASIGLFLIVASIIYLILYVFTLLAICKSKDLIELPCYRIMVALGLFDIIQVTFIGLFPGCMMFVNFVQDSVNKTIAAILMSSWYGGMTLTTMLSVDRLVTVFRGSDSDNIFSGKKVFIWIGAAVVYAFGHFVSYCCLDIGMMWNSQSVHYGFYNTTESLVAQMIELASDSIMQIIMILCYICLGILLKVRRMNGTSGKLTPNDMKALVSSFLVASTILVSTAYHFIANFLTHRILGFGTCSWLVQAGNNSIYYFAFNGTIRKAIFKLIIPKKVHVAPVHKLNTTAGSNNSAPGTNTTGTR